MKNSAYQKNKALTASINLISQKEYPNIEFIRSKSKDLDQI